MGLPKPMKETTPGSLVTGGRGSEPKPKDEVKVSEKKPPRGQRPTISGGRGGAPQ